MKSWIAGAAAAVLFIAQPVCAQQSGPIAPVGVEAGVVMGIIAQPYATVGVVRAPWLVRVSGGAAPDNCYGLQLNAGRVVRDEGNAKHTLGAMWARFRNACWYGRRSDRPARGQYAGVVYDFQVKGFFLEVGPAFGTRNPVVSFLGGPLSHVYGQIGYVHRFGKTYVDDEDR